GHRQRDEAGVTRDFQVELRTHDGGTVWVRMNARALRDGDREDWEGTIEDITNQRRAVEAERRAETLRAVAQLANAAAPALHHPARRDRRPPRAAPPGSHARAAGEAQPDRRVVPSDREDHHAHGPDDAAGDPRRSTGLADARPAPLVRAHQQVSGRQPAGAPG